MLNFSFYKIEYSCIQIDKFLKRKRNKRLLDPENR